MCDKIAGSLIGGIWGTADVVLQPCIVLCRWRALEIVGGTMNGQRHLVGYSVEDCEGRVSTSVVSFDQAEMAVVTSSGRVYRLQGPSGNDPDGEYVWKSWARINGATSTKDVSCEYSPCDQTDPF